MRGNKEKNVENVENVESVENQSGADRASSDFYDFYDSYVFYDSHPPPAFTLLETVASLAILSVLILAIGSTIVVATNAIPQPGDPNVNVIRAAEVLDQINAEIETATGIGRAPHAISLLVSDRDDDGDPELIQYAWSGVSGDPLLRSTNGSPTAVVLPSVERFVLSYRMTKTKQTYAGIAIENNVEIPLARRVGAASHEQTVTGDQGAGQHISPNLLPGDAVAYRVSRLAFRGKKDASGLLGGLLGTLLSGSFNAKLRLAGPDGKPAGPVISFDSLSLPLLDSTLSWRFLHFNTPPVPANRDVALTIDGRTLTGALKVETTAQPGGRLDTNNGGSSWTYLSDSTLTYELYGYPLTPGPEKTLVRRFVSRVDLTLDVAGDGPPLRSATTMLKRPQLLRAHWRTNFERDPTTRDRTLDGAPDFARRDGLAFDTTTLSNGIWHSQGQSALITRPPRGFKTPTIVKAAMRTVEQGGPGACIWIDGEYRTADSRGAPIWAELTLEANDTQTLRLYNQPSAGAPGTLLQEVRDLPARFVDVRLIVDPADNSVNLQANGVDHGTFAYQRFFHNASTRFAAAYSVQADGEFDRFEVRLPEAAP